jgi:acyl dehydratase
VADTSKVGMELPPTLFKVERVKIKEMVEAIGDPNPIYVDAEAAAREGHPDTPCPPTFFTMALQEFTGHFFRVLEELDMPLARMLQGEEEYEYLKPVYPGAILTLNTTVESIREKKSQSGDMDLVTLRTRFVDESGEDVLLSRTLVIERK